MFAIPGANLVQFLFIFGRGSQPLEQPGSVGNGGHHRNQRFLNGTLQQGNRIPGSERLCAEIFLFLHHRDQVKPV